MGKMLISQRNYRVPVMFLKFLLKRMFSHGIFSYYKKNDRYKK